MGISKRSMLNRYEKIVNQLNIPIRDLMLWGFLPSYG